MQLYALCDRDLLIKHNVSLERFVQIASGAKIIQYRDKSGDISHIKQQLIKLRQLYDGFLIINDHFELVEYCDGVHLGQDDLFFIDKNISKAMQSVRGVVGRDKIVGLSTHNRDEILKANEMDLNYIGLGAYRTTSTKVDVRNVLGDEVEQLALLSKHPVAVIGGVKKGDNFKNITYKVIGSDLFV